MINELNDTIICQNGEQFTKAQIELMKQDLFHILQEYTIVFIKEKIMIALWLLHTKKKKRQSY